MKPKILIVDDRAENLLLLRGLLRRHDADLLEAACGEEALELLLHNRVALALVDVQMPKMNGYQLANLMRAAERTREIPLIFVTAGFADRAEAVGGHDMGFEVGAVDFLVKPIDARVLANKVEAFLRLHQQKEEFAERVTELEAKLRDR